MYTIEYPRFVGGKFVTTTGVQSASVPGTQGSACAGVAPKTATNIPAVRTDSRRATERTPVTGELFTCSRQ